MKLSTILKITSGLFVANLLITAPANAADVKTAGQAMTLCKAQAEKAHPDYKRSKSSRIRQVRGVFKIKMKVVTNTESISTFCEVTKDGAVTYAKA